MIQTTQEPGSTAVAPSSLARALLSAMVILGALAISVGAAWISYLTIRDLAEYFGWGTGTAWLVMPLIELFLLVGSAELALRVLERHGGRAAPATMAYGALLVTLACNIADHVLRLHPGVPFWRAAILGGFASVVPVAQICALHLLTGRLMRMAEGRAAAAAESRGPSLLTLARTRATAAIAARLAVPAESFTPAPFEPPAASPAESSASDSALVPAGSNGSAGRAVASNGRVESLVGRLSDDSLRDAARPFVEEHLDRHGRVPGEHRIREYVMRATGAGASTKRCGEAARAIAAERQPRPAADDSPAPAAEPESEPEPALAS